MSREPDELIVIESNDTIEALIAANTNLKAELAIANMEIEYLESGLKAAKKWIRVKDELPNTNGVYLVYRPNMGNGINMALCYFNGSHTTPTWHDNYGVDFTRVLNAGDVTHWQSRPAPPKKGNKDE